MVGRRDYDLGVGYDTIQVNILKGGKSINSPMGGKPDVSPHPPLHHITLCIIMSQTVSLRLVAAFFFHLTPWWVLYLLGGGSA